MFFVFGPLWFVLTVIVLYLLYCVIVNNKDFRSNPTPWIKIINVFAKGVGVLAISVIVLITTIIVSLILFALVGNKIPVGDTSSPEYVKPIKQVEQRNQSIDPELREWLNNWSLTNSVTLTNEPVKTNVIYDSVNKTWYDKEIYDRIIKFRESKR